MSDLVTIEQGWDEAARSDAFGNILTIPGLSVPEFWAAGDREIRDLITRLNPRTGRALDFGCGVGRLTQALAARCGQVDGVDISGEMVALARRHNQHRNVTYHHVTTGDLALFEDSTFDLVYTSIVLQHMPPTLAEVYVREFLRVTRPGGHVVFQIPDGPDLPGGCLAMFGTPRATVEEWVTDATLVDVETNDAAGGAFESYRYTVVA